MKTQHILITLADGNPNGMLIAENPNGTVRITLCPRNLLLNREQVANFKRPGVYCLLGKDPNDNQDVIYIGESDNLSDRFNTHRNDAKKNFWEKTIVMTSKDENLNKAHVLYLQNLLFNATRNANRIRLLSGQNPDKPFLSNVDQVYAINFFEQVQTILPVLGFRFAESVSEAPQAEVKDSPIFEMTYGGAIATAHETNGKFVVLKHSTARIASTASIGDSSKQLRDNLVYEGLLKATLKADYWIFAQNVPFSSPSAAASVIGGASLNGRICWKVKGTGQTYAEWQESQM